MDSQNITHRTGTNRDTDRDNPADVVDTTMNTSDTHKTLRNRRDKRMAMAKRGLRSLAISVSLSLSLTLLNIYLLGSQNGYGTASKPFWFPPLWVLHMTCLACSFLMGLSAWLVWAEAGFHKNPTALSFYLAQLGLSLVWSPIMFPMGAAWFGIIVCLGMFGTLVGCSYQFKKVNPIAGDLVKLCVAWAAYLAIVNLKLVFL